MSEHQIPERCQDFINNLMARLPALLGKNLYSCVLYGSAVRGDFKPKLSDINILIVLNESTPEAHRVISESIQESRVFNPFVITRKGMERSFDAFAMKFRSIKRNYRVLYGDDPLTDFTISDDRARFLCEQSLRNLRLRIVRMYVVNRLNRKKYLSMLLSYYPNVFAEIGEVLRLSGKDAPRDYGERVSAIEKAFNVDGKILRDYIKLKNHPGALRSRDIEHFHHGLFNLLNSLVNWVEEKWTMTF